MPLEGHIPTFVLMDHRGRDDDSGVHVVYATCEWSMSLWLLIHEERLKHWDSECGNDLKQLDSKHEHHASTLAQKMLVVVEVEIDTTRHRSSFE